MKNSGGLNQIVLQFPNKSATFLVLHRASQVALRLCLPAQQAPECVAMFQAHDRFRRPCAALGAGVLAARELPPTKPQLMFSPEQLAVCCVADWQPASLVRACRLPVGDTAGYQPALQTNARDS